MYSILFGSTILPLALPYVVAKRAAIALSKATDHAVSVVHGGKIVATFAEVLDANTCAE